MSSRKRTYIFGDDKGRSVETVQQIITTFPVVAANFLNSAWGPGMVNELFPDRTFKSEDPADDIQEIIAQIERTSKCIISLLDEYSRLLVGDC